MSRTLVTGGTGFIGSHVARALAARGDELRLLIRRGARIEHLADLDYERVTGDVTDIRAVRRAMKDVERVFHVAGTTSLRVHDHDRVFDINLGGTRNVLEAAFDAGVERVVHTSSVAAIGPAPPGRTADEAQPFTAGELGIAYVNSKHEAEVEALRYATRGLDVVCVNPTFVLGPDAPTHSSMGLVRRFLQRQIPVYVDGGLNIVDVRDVAAGHVLADEKGRSGERYILGGRNFTLQRLFADLSRISGVAPPAMRMPAPLAVGGVEVMRKIGIPLPVSREEVRSATLWWTYRSTKAKNELGFEARPHEETLEDSVRWQLSVLGDGVAMGRAPIDVPLRMAGRALKVGERLVGR